MKFTHVNSKAVNPTKKEMSINFGAYLSLPKSSLAITNFIDEEKVQSFFKKILPGENLDKKAKYFQITKF